MKAVNPLGGSIDAFLRERRRWLDGARLETLVPAVLRLERAAIYTALGEMEPAQAELERVDSAGPMPVGLELDYLHHACNLFFQFSLWDKMDPMRDRLLALARQADFRPGIARGLYFTGLETINGGDYQRAIDIFLQALDIEKDLTDDALLGEIYNDVGFCYRRIGDTARAERQYLESLQVRERSGNLLGQAESLSNLGYLKIFQGLPEQAEALLVRAYLLETRIGDRIGAGYTLVNLGYLAYQRGEFAKSREYHQKALELRTKLDDPLGQGHCYLQLYALAGIDDDEAAERRLMNAAYRAFVRAGDNTGQQGARLAFVSYWLERGDHQVAQRILDRIAPEIARTESQDSQRTYWMRSLLAALQRTDPGAVERCWTEYRQCHPDIEGTCDTLDMLARVEMFRGNHEAAGDAWAKAIALAREKHFPLELAKQRFSLGRSLGRTGYRLIEESRDEFQKIGAKRLARKAREYLSTTAGRP
ncbi:MAG TPA: tetratricopeptide repeat protein [Candidatus Edwardsbacteria bacterium]|nr:tetratricopeptide repeat protein [Candidatus Edwardsbacteria bacterium]